MEHSVEYARMKMREILRDSGIEGLRGGWIGRIARDSPFLDKLMTEEITRYREEKADDVDCTNQRRGENLH